jgi:hypothetical protein
VTLAPKGLLIEEQRVNLLLRSEEFDNASWVTNAASINPNSVVAPDGTISADTLVENTANDTHRTHQVITKAASAISYTWTVYAKSAGRSLYLNADSTSVLNAARVGFNLVTGEISIAASTAGTFSNATASITPAGNSWYRCSISFISGSETSLRCAAWLIETGGAATSYLGDGASGIFLWGAQLEQGAFATSYIPSVASQVTRAADNASMIGNNFARWYNVNEGTLYANFNTVASTNFPQTFNLSDGGTANSIAIDAQSGLRAVVSVAGSTAALFTSSKTGSGDVVSLGYKVNDFAASFNGAAPQIDNTGTLPMLTTAGIGRSGTASNFLNGTIKRIAYFNRRLANSELQGITS